MSAQENVSKDVLHVGMHEFRFVAPDRLIFAMRGEFTEADCGAYIDFVFLKDPARASILYSFYDLTKMTRVDERARKRVIRVNEKYPYGGIALTTANFSTRALVGMILRAGKLVAPDQLSFPYKFVNSMDEANAWFDELRTMRG